MRLTLHDFSFRSSQKLLNQDDHFRNEFPLSNEIVSSDLGARNCFDSVRGYVTFFRISVQLLKSRSLLYLY